MGERFEALQQRAPVADAIVFHPHQVDVRGGAEEAFLQVLAESIVDGQGDDERGDSGGDADDGDRSDDSDDRLAALGAKIAGGDEELEAHQGIIEAAERGAGGRGEALPDKIIVSEAMYTDKVMVARNSERLAEWLSTGY